MKRFIFGCLSLLSLCCSAYSTIIPGIHKKGECNLLALSGGGSFGMVEVGILKSLYDKNQIPSEFDVISGISAGGLNAGFLSYYNDTERGILDLYDVYAKLKNNKVYEMELLKILKNWSIYSTAPLKETLKKIIDEKIIDNGHTPYTIIGASNVYTEHLDIYHFNSMAPKDRVGLLLSTSAIPVVFPPQHFNGSLYVDGGVISNEIIYQLLQYVDCRSYHIYFIRASEHVEADNKVDGLFSYLSSIVKLLYNTFNYQISEISHNSCTNPIGSITTCFPNSTELDKYSILDFNNGEILYDIARKHNYCHKFPLC